LPLTRGGGGGGPALAVPDLPSAASAPAKPEAGDAKATARRELAGMRLIGPIADRPIVSYVAPHYPEWAKREAVEGSVTLYFVVLADGRVKENIVVQKTAGFEDFDENARAALRTWRFQPLRGGRTGEQWGTITIHYRLTDAG
jgi:TonB family protein